MCTIFEFNNQRVRFITSDKLERYTKVVEWDNGYLSISAAKGLDKDEQDKEGKYIRKELYAGPMIRSFYVGNAITQDDIKAKYESGILRLSVPKKAAEEIESAKRIAIEG